MPSRRFAPILAALSLGVLAPGATTSAQSEPVELAKDKFLLDPVGLSMQLPLDSKTASTEFRGEQLAASVRGPNNDYLIKIRTPKTGDREADVTEALTRTIDGIRARFGIADPGGAVVETTAQLLALDRDLVIGSQACERAYISIPDQEGDERMVFGWTFFKPRPDQFVVFELVVPEKRFARVRPIYEASVATARFEDPTTAMQMRQAALDAGRVLLASVGPEDYRRAMHEEERWFRLYRPAETGEGEDTELGYRGVRFWEGQRGEINPGRSSRDFNATERQEGLLCRIQARVLIDASTIADTTATFFMTQDREQEAWYVATAVRDRSERQLAFASETGTRDGEELVVKITRAGSEANILKPSIGTRAYLNQFETFVLPALLVEAAGEGTLAFSEVAFYAYRSATQAVSLRTEDVAREASGQVQLTTTLREGAPPKQSIYNADALLLRVEEGDGSVWVPTTKDDLFALWRSKGLPTGKTENRRRRR